LSTQVVDVHKAPVDVLTETPAAFTEHVVAAVFEELPFDDDWHPVRPIVANEAKIRIKFFISSSLSFSAFAEF
jgi:hypothetical protein